MMDQHEVKYIKPYFTEFSGSCRCCALCSCSCTSPHCHYCRPMISKDGGVNRRCDIANPSSKQYILGFHPYSRHHICFKCRIGGKEMYCCRICKKMTVPASRNLRIPKKNDLKSWKLLELLFTKNTFRESKKGTLAHLWYRGNGIGCTIHLPKEISELLMIPTKLYQYDDWCKYMNNTMSYIGKSTT